jgi:hypothetical protein
VEFPKTANLPPATYRVTFSYPYDQVTAVDRTDSEQAGQGFRVLPFIEKRVTPLFGWFSMTGLPSSIELSPGGLGYTIGTIAGNTQVRMSGYLGDGQPFAMSGRRSAWGQVIFWCRPYANPKSWIGGIADTDVSPPADPTVRNFAIPLSTEVRWYKEPDDRSRSYPDGFLNAPLPSGRPGVLSGDFYTWQGAPALKDWLAHQAESPLVLRLQGNSLPDWPIQRLPLKALGGSDEGTKAKGFEVPVRPNSSISGKDGVDANATLNTRNGRFNGILSHLGEVEKNYAFDGIVATDVFLSAQGFIKIPVKGKHGRTFVTAELETE